MWSEWIDLSKQSERYMNIKFSFGFLSRSVK